ncbi:Imm26 family immunity protein [Fusibacter sp. JL298sf-3]
MRLEITYADTAFFHKALKEIEESGIDGNSVILQVRADAFPEVSIETLKAADTMLLSRFSQITFRLYAGRHPLDLSKLTALEHLRVLTIEASDIVNWPVLPSLESLMLTVDSLTTFEGLKSMQALKNLTIGRGKSTRPDLAVLASLTLLESLSIVKYTKGLEVIASLPNLKVLHLSSMRLKKWPAFPTHTLSLLKLHAVKADSPFSKKSVRATAVELSKVETLDEEAYVPAFELSNFARPFFGLPPIPEDWERVALNAHLFLYFDGDTVKRRLSVTDDSYREELLELKTEGRHTLLPKTAKGKHQKLTPATLSRCKPQGVYFSYTRDERIVIGNYTTQRALYGVGLFDKERVSSYEALMAWVANYVAQTTATDLKTVERFKSAKRKRHRFKAGDFFRFKTGRRTYGYGRVLLDIGRLRKSPDFKAHKHYGLANLPMQPVTVKIYHIIDDGRATIESLDRLSAMPAQHIADNNLLYGDFEIMGHLPLKPEAYDFPISFGRSISAKDRGTVYLQWGEIFCETQDASLLEPYLEHGSYRNEAIGFHLDIEGTSELSACIDAGSNAPYWEKYRRRNDLRHPDNTAIRREIFSFFGLDSNKRYSDALADWRV